MARCRSRRGGTRSFCHETAGSQGCTEVSETRNEALRPAKSHRDRPPRFLRCRDESHWGRGSSDLRSVAQQSSRKLTPSVPPTSRSDGQVQRHQDPPAVCCRPRLHPQSFQPGTSSLQSRELQTQSLRRLGRVASTCSLSVLDCWLYWSDQVSLTMPLKGLDCRFYRSDPVSLTMPNWSSHALRTIRKPPIAHISSISG